MKTKAGLLSMVLCSALLLSVAACKEETPLVFAPQVPTEFPPIPSPPPPPALPPVVPAFPGPGPGPAVFVAYEKAERTDPLLFSGRLTHALSFQESDAGVPLLPGYTKGTAYFSVPILAVGEREFIRTGVNFNSAEASVLLPAIDPPDDKLKCRANNVRRTGPIDAYGAWPLAIDFLGIEGDCKKLVEELGYYGFRIDFKNLQLSPTDVRARAELRVFSHRIGTKQWVAERWSAPVVPIAARASISARPVEIKRNPAGAIFLFSLGEIDSATGITSLRWDDADETALADNLDPCQIKSIKVLPQYSGTIATMLVTTRGEPTAECRSKIYALSEEGFTLKFKNISVMVPAGTPHDFFPLKLNDTSYLKVTVKAPRISLPFPLRTAPLSASFTISNGQTFAALPVKECRRITEADGSKRISFEFGADAKPAVAFDVKDVPTPKEGDAETTYVSKNTEESESSLISPFLILRTNELETKKDPADPNEKASLLSYYSYPMGYLVSRRHCRVLFSVNVKNAVRGRFDCLGMIRMDIHGHASSVDANGTFRCSLK